MSDDLVVTLVLKGENRDQLQKIAQSRAAIVASFQDQSQAINNAKRGFSEYEDQATASAKRSAEAFKTQARQIEQAQTQMQSRIKSAFQIGAGLAGINLGVAGVRAFFETIISKTQEATQAQFAFNATFGNNAALYTRFVAEQAEATKRTTAEVQKAVVAFGSLSKNYAIDSQQIQELTRRSADLAAVKGITTVEAASRLESALRGEAEAAEYLGLTLNSDYLKKFAVMTAEQRRNWETLDPLTKAQITYNEVLRQTEPLLGTAAARSVDAMDRTKTASSNLAVSLGRELRPELDGIAQATEKSLFWFEQFIRAVARAGRDISKGNLVYTPPVGMTVDHLRGLAQAYPPTFVEGAVEDAAREAANKQRQRDEMARRASIERQLTEARETIDAQVKLELDAIDKERKAKEAWFAEERRRIEARRYYVLEDIEKRRDAELKRIQEVAQEQKDADEEAIKDAERRKAADLAAVEEAHDQVLAAIKSRQEALARDRETESRAREDARQSADRQIKDARKSEDHDRETDHRAEMRRLEERHTTAVRNFEKEAQAAERAHERATKALQQRTEQESERHRTAVQNIADEERRQLTSIQVQIDALDNAQRSEDNSDRLVGHLPRLWPL